MHPLAGHDASSRSLRLWLLGAWLAAVAGLFPWDVAEREQLLGFVAQGKFDTVVSDLERIPPRLLVLDRQRDQQGMAYGRPFDFLGYFSASPRFVAVLSRYRRAGAIGPFEVYELVR